MTSALVRIQPGLYRTRDARYEVSLDENYETECDDPHPVRYSTERLARFSDFYRRSLLARGRVYRDPRTGREYVAYQCPGNESHFYARWIVWDTEIGDYPEGTGPDGFDTLREAREFALACVSEDAS